MTSAGRYTLHPSPFTLHPTLYTLHATPYTLHPTPCTLTLHPTPYTLHPAHYTLHPNHAPCTLNPTPCTLHTTHCTLTLHPKQGARCETARLVEVVNASATIRDLRIMVTPEVSSGRILMIHTSARRKLWIILVILKQCLVLIGQKDRPTECL